MKGLIGLRVERYKFYLIYAEVTIMSYDVTKQFVYKITSILVDKIKCASILTARFRRGV